MNKKVNKFINKGNKKTKKYDFTSNEEEEQDFQNERENIKNNNNKHKIKSIKINKKNILKNGKQIIILAIQQIL